MSEQNSPSTVAARLAPIFPERELVLVDRIDEMAVRFDTLPDQRPCTCGAFSLMYLLEPLGYAFHEGRSLIEEDYLAHLASVVIDEYEVAPSEDIAARVARGELTEREAMERYPKLWYRFPVRHSADQTVNGTSPTGIARAIAIGTYGQLVSLPIASRLADGSPQLTEDRWEGLLELLGRKVHEWKWHAILNFHLLELLKPNVASFTVENLRNADPSAVIPLDDWDVGHFVGLGGIWRGADPWLLLLDTYKERGFEGYQPQPASMMRRGLLRADGRGGGIQLVLPRDVLDEAAAAIGALGLEARMWHNGSPEPEGWIWEVGL